MSIAARTERESSALLPLVLDRDLQAILGKQRGDVLRPFDEHERVGSKRLPRADLREFLGTLDAIGVDMDEREAVEYLLRIRAERAQYL